MAGFARYLYVPEDGSRLSSRVANSIEDGLRDAGLGQGPDGDGTSWRPFRPAGALQQYAEQLGLVYPTLNVDWYDEPHPVTDPFLPPRGPWSRCPTCARVVPNDGVMLIDDELVTLKSCDSCASPFDAYMWPRAEDRVVFRSRLIISLVADAYRETLPTFADGCPALRKCVEEIIDVSLSEVFVVW